MRRPPLTRDAIVQTARNWLGTPYVHQASAKGAGTDCLGLIRGVWRDCCGPEPETPPPYAPDWSERQGDALLRDAAARWLIPYGSDTPRIGQVALFRITATGPARHLGIVSAEDRFIHAYAGRCVTESWLSRWWLSRLHSLYDYPGVTGP